jgi:hypothetical protein
MFVLKLFKLLDTVNVVRKLYHFGVHSFLFRWICSFLTQRSQRVKLLHNFSEWLTLKGSMPQGTWLGPLIFILLINDLSTSWMLHKYVDDSTLSEFLKKGEHSSIDIYFDKTVDWS